MLDGVSRAVADPMLPWWIEFLRAKAVALGRAARWNEGCRCHEHLLFGRARQQHVEQHRASSCPWAGR
eukprot:6086102-Alexandrium_andersonii.AAC.1